jgi:hypothetical protein
VKDNFGDGSPVVSAAKGVPVPHTYLKPGTLYTITTTAIDSEGSSATRTVYFSTAGSDYTAYGPTRILDTRKGLGAVGPLRSGVPVSLKIAGNGAIPSTASAYAANLTITAPTGSGLIIAYPTGSTRPATSNLNYSKGQTIAGLSQVPADGSGDFTLYNQESAGTVQMIADIFGYYTSY